MRNSVLELTADECRKVVAVLMRDGYPPPPVGYPFSDLLYRLVHKGQITMEQINVYLEAA